MHVFTCNRLKLNKPSNETRLLTTPYLRCIAPNFLPQEANPISYKLFFSPAPHTIHLNNERLIKSGIPFDILTPLPPPQTFEPIIIQKPKPKPKPASTPLWPQPSLNSILTQWDKQATPYDVKLNPTKSRKQHPSPPNLASDDFPQSQSYAPALSKTLPINNENNNDNDNDNNTSNSQDSKDSNMIDEHFRLIPNQSEHSDDIFPPDMSQPTCCSYRELQHLVKTSFPDRQEEFNTLLQNSLSTSCNPAILEATIKGWHNK
jgi:hypothetical protein